MDEQTDLLGEIRGESLSPMDTPVNGSESSSGGTNLLDAMVAVLTAPFVLAATPFTTFGEAVSDGAGVLTNVGTAGAAAWGGAVEDVTEAATPANLFGFGLGASIGGIAAASTLAVIGAFAADQVFFAGAGTRSLVSRVAR